MLEVARRLAAITVSIDIADKVETSQQVARQLDVQNISTRRAACTQALLIFLGIILQPYELRLSALWMPGVYSWVPGIQGAVINFMTDCLIRHGC